MIRKACQADIPSIAAIYERILAAQDRGILSTGWVRGVYPTEKTAQEALEQGELFVLEETLDTMIDLLNEDGRLAIITFHSLEDRIVKNNFKRNEDPCTCPKDFPVCVCGKKSKGKVLTRKPILPTEKELGENSRSKSAKLRVFVKKSEG